MKTIFLSMPNWISNKYTLGMTNFTNLLRSLELSPRTIGTTDFPSKSPMDAVIELMHECEGAIILGYPQIMIEVGKIKDTDIQKTLELSTEWNHIEAGLAHALGLPLLIIHHPSVTRGIFDRGVVNNFLYQKDFSDSSWPLSQDITGALSKWKSLLQPISLVKAQNNVNEEIKVKWGCFTFPPDDKMYCPTCYNNKSMKMLTTRVDSKNRRCTSCMGTIPTG